MNDAQNHDATSPAYVVRYTQSFEAALEAGRFFQARLLRWYYAAFAAGTVVGTLTAILMPNLRFAGIAVALFCALMLVMARFAVMDRVAVRRQIRSVLGQPIELRIGEEGIGWHGPTGTAVIPWNSLTEVRASERTVLFIRDRLLVAYAPADGFASPDEQAQVVAYARSRVAGRGRPSVE
jgi:hypothetical protein